MSEIGNQKFFRKSEGKKRRKLEVGNRNSDPALGITNIFLQLRRVLREYDSDLLTHKHLKWSSLQKAKREMKELIKNWVN